MNPTRRFFVHVLMGATLCVLGATLWILHVRAWDLGGRSPILNYDTAQYALAARELADHGRLATTFALPVELVGHASPPWPLAVVQPGLVIAEAALFKVPWRWFSGGGRLHVLWDRPDRREWLVLVLPFLCYLAAGAALGFAVAHLLRRHAPDLPEGWCGFAGLVAGAGFLLDPEAQHFAAGGFTELPFTLGLIAAVAALALDWAPARPLAFGLLLGVAGSFRANMLWLAPLFALGAAAVAPPGRRARVLVLAIGGWALVGAPWWFYKWRAFGAPGWDLTRWVVWDGVEGRSWLSIYHPPQMPDLPAGLEGVRLLAQKLARTLPELLLAVFTGPRALWIGALALWALIVPGPRALRIAAVATLAAFGLGLLAAAVSIPWLRYVFPSRVLVETAGLFALWGLLAHWAGSWRAPLARGLSIGAAVLVLGWGGWQTARGAAEARATAASRDVPSTDTLIELYVLMNHELPPGEPVMSNLGPILAWNAQRPVVHLALTPGDVEGCRRLLDVRHVLLVYRDAARAGTEWGEIVERPGEAPRHPEWNVLRSRLWTTTDGFRVVWLELGPVRRVGMAGTTGAARTSG